MRVTLKTTQVRATLNNNSRTPPSWIRTTPATTISLIKKSREVQVQALSHSLQRSHSSRRYALLAIVLSLFRTLMPRGLTPKTTLKLGKSYLTNNRRKGYNSTDQASQRHWLRWGKITHSQILQGMTRILRWSMVGMAQLHTWKGQGRLFLISSSTLTTRHLWSEFMKMESILRRFLASTTSCQTASKGSWPLQTRRLASIV